MLRIVCQQLAPEVGRLRGNVDLATDAIADSLADGADLIVLPELVTSGYVFRSDAEVRAAALPMDSGHFDTWRGLVEPADAVMVAGFPELGPGGAVYNSAVVIDAEGVLAVYRKAHLWGEEKRWFTPGSDPPPVVSTRVGRVGVLICYDLEFPETVRDLAIRGAEIVAIPTNWPMHPAPGGERPALMGNAMVAARLSRVFLACCDRAGTERGIDWTGGSCVVDPEGWVLAERPARDAGPVAAEVDLALARDKAVGPRNDVLGDRRPELYGSLTQEPDEAG